MHHDPAEAALESQQQLVESALPLVFTTYDEALAEEQQDPLVLLLDCEDELGGQIARGWIGDEAVDNAIAIERQSSDDDTQTTVYAHAMPWRECRQALGEAFPYLTDVLDSGPPPKGVLVIGVTAGGASALTAPHDVR